MSSEGGFPSDAYERLARHEPGNYWFETRNRLIVWAMRRYFPDAASFLEIGCGTGFVLQAVRAAFPGARLAGSDFLGGGLSVARQRVPSASFDQADARTLLLADPVDVIGAFDVLEHIKEDVAVLERIFASTRPGGGLLVTVPQHPSLWSRVDDVGHHVRRYRRRELVDRVRGCGFEVERVTSFVSLLLPAMAVSRWLDKRRTTPFEGDELGVSPGVNAILRSILEVEGWLIRLGVSWPAGGSLLLVARRPRSQQSLRSSP